MTIIDSPSPNQGERPLGARPRLIVLHGTVGTDQGDLEWCRNPASGVSYHYLILRTGQVHRLVRPERRAWHAGESSWQGTPNVNDFSIGIGLSNLGDSTLNAKHPDLRAGEPYRDAQYRSAAQLIQILMREYRIPMSGILGHYHVSPGRKTDPWYTFEWAKLFSILTAGT